MFCFALPSNPVQFCTIGNNYARQELESSIYK